jgi:hypothetical protein
MPRRNSHSVSRYSASASRGRNFNKTKSRTLQRTQNSRKSRNNRSRKHQDARLKQREFDKSIRDTQQFLDKHLKNLNEFSNIRKTNLNNSWSLALKHSKNGNYLKAAKFALLTYTIGLVLMDRHGVLKKSSGVNTKISNPNLQTMMTGIQYRPTRRLDPNLEHKPIVQAEIDKARGFINFSKYPKRIADKLVSDYEKVQANESGQEKLMDPELAGDTFDFLYTLNNPHVKQFLGYITN